MPGPAAKKTVPTGVERLHNSRMKTVRTAVQAAQAAINGARSKGPKTAEGKSASSLNSLRHGLSANNLLLPGEDAQEYELHLDGYFATFAPVTLPEAQVVAQVGDLTWKLERLTRLENNRMRARLEEELEKMDPYKAFVLTRRALQMVDALAEIVEAIPLPPEEAERTGAFLNGVERMVVELREVPELPLAVVQPFADALDATKKSQKGTCISKSTYKHLGDMAKLARGALTAKLAQEEAALEPVRERLAAAVLLLEDADLRKLERHRRLLESSMAQQMDLLAQVCAQIATMKAENSNGSKEMRVRLRVVS